MAETFQKAELLLQLEVGSVDELCSVASHVMRRARLSEGGCVAAV